MTGAGLIFMLTSWGVILGLNALCFTLLMRADRRGTTGDKKPG